MPDKQGVRKGGAGRRPLGGRRWPGLVQRMALPQQLEAHLQPRGLLVLRRGLLVLWRGLRQKEGRVDVVDWACPSVVLGSCAALWPKAMAGSQESNRQNAGL